MVQNQKLVELIENISFLSDNIKFNATLYQGMKIMLDKLSNIEKTLMEMSKKEDKSEIEDGND
jgi:hypothetical protein